jgi:AcrR family transcriptional regulator
MHIRILDMTAQKTRPTAVQWVRTPHQDRSRKTLERLLDSAEALLEERGFDTVSVAEIAQAAGSSVGAFYARFRDKNGLLHHLHERFCEEAMATSDAALAPERWADATVVDILSDVVRSMAEIYRTRRGMFRAFMMVGCTDSRFKERDRRLVQHFLSRLTGLLLARRVEIEHPDPEFAIAFGMELVAGVLRDRYIFDSEAGGVWPAATEALVPELIRAYGCYLGLRGTAEQIPSVPQVVGS